MAQGRLGAPGRGAGDGVVVGLRRLGAFRVLARATALMTLWHRVTDESDRSDEDSGASKDSGSAQAPQANDDPAARPSAWRTEPALRLVRRRYHAGTWVLTLMFALRLVVEVPLYLAGAQAVSYLGVARLILGVPLYAVTLWFIWLLVAPSRIAQAQALAQR